MWKNFVGAISVLAILATGQNVTTTKEQKNDIQRPQESTLFRIMKLGTAYNVDEGSSIEDAYKEYRKNNTLAQEVKSEHYPKPYPAGDVTEKIHSVEKATGMEIVIHDLDINPIKDFLKLDPILKDGKTFPGMIFTGQLKKPVKFRFLGSTEVKIQFGAGSEDSHKHRGFLLTYAPFGNVTEPSPPPSEPIVPFDKLPDYSTALLIPKNARKNETWMLFKNLLCEASNNYLAEKNLNLDNCTDSSVTIKSVIKCPDQWPASSDCVTMSYAVSLYAVEDKDNVHDPFVEESKVPAGFSKEQLQEAWTKFGKMAFEKAGFPEYALPSISTAILIWLGVGFGIVLFAIIVLIIVCRVKTLGGYWPASDDDRAEIISHNPELDIRMFASPEQVIPPLFPAGVGGYTAETYGSESRAPESEALKMNGAKLNGAINSAFITDEELLRKRQTFVEGVNRDETST